MENTVRFVNTLYSTELPHKHIVGLALLTLKSEPLGFCLVSAVFLSIHRVSSQKCVTSVSGSRNLPYYSRIIIWRQLPRSHSLPRRSTSHQRTMFKSGPSNQVSFIQLSFLFQRSLRSNSHGITIFDACALAVIPGPSECTL